MKVLSAMQLKNGAKAEGAHVSATLTQPIQFLLDKEKDDKWTSWNLDWFETRGLDYLRDNARGILKTYDLLLNTKYNVVMNQKTIERVKNFFQ